MIPFCSIHLSYLQITKTWIHFLFSALKFIFAVYTKNAPLYDLIFHSIRYFIDLKSTNTCTNVCTFYWFLMVYFIDLKSIWNAVQILFSKGLLFILSFIHNYEKVYNYYCFLTIKRKICYQYFHCKNDNLGFLLFTIKYLKLIIYIFIFLPIFLPIHLSI